MGGALTERRNDDRVGVGGGYEGRTDRLLHWLTLWRVHLHWEERRSSDVRKLWLWLELEVQQRMRTDGPPRTR